MDDLKSKGGWITLNRSIKKHWIWTDALYLHMWIDFLLRANYETNKIFIDSSLITLKRGQFVTSQKKLAKQYKCSISKIRHFLYLLQDDSMIELKTTHRFTQITICNYSLYQDLKHTERNQKENRRKTERNQKETENQINKKNNNNNKETKEKMTSTNSSFNTNSVQYQLSLLLYNQIKSNNLSIYRKSPDLQSWAKEIDIMINKDNRTDDEIFDAILFTQEDGFWQNIIINPKRLRQNFQTILTQQNN